MLALQFHEYGEADVLTVGEAAEPHAGPGQVRIAVRAASVNPVDWKVRAGYLEDFFPVTFPAIPGADAAGVVDEVGEGVDSVEVGDAVFGLGNSTNAEFAVLDAFTIKPESMDFQQAAALGLAAETAARTLDMLGVTEGSTVVLDGAAGGVGSCATQFAVERGARVIGTASPEHHDYLKSLGATPTTHGPGLPDRVAELAPSGVDAAIDLAGLGSIPDLIAITGDPSRVVTAADVAAGQHGVRLADHQATGRATYALEHAAQLFDDGRLTISLEKVFPLAEAAQAHRISEGRHVQGKLVLTVP
jgi:NADPH:quinone reductase-like Zn-dependent oxidoreductase